MTWKILPFAFALITAGCATENQSTGESQGAQTAGSPNLDEASASTVTKTSTAEPVKIVFFDSRIFDRELSRAMQSSSAEIVIEVPVGFSLNEIPQRVDRWLYSVKDSGGDVIAEPETKTRGLVGAAIDVVVSFFERVDEHLTFAPSDQYSATLVYKTDGTVNKVVFARR